MRIRRPDRRIRRSDWPRASSARTRSAWKFKAGYDDSLDVVGVHFVGGVVGTFLIGLLAAEVVSGGVEGLFYGGGLSLLGKQTLAIPVVAIFAFVVSFVVGEGHRHDFWIPHSARGRDLRDRSRPAR